MKECSEYKHKVTKIIRGRYLNLAMPLLKHGSKYHILYLVRDPRGVIASRYHIEKQKRKDPDIFHSMRTAILNSTRNRCNVYKRNLEYLVKKVEFTNATNFRIIRYEDLAYNPLSMAESIYNFLGINLPKSVKNWITRSTVNRVSNSHHGTKRNSASAAEAWRHDIPYDLALEMDVQCAEVLQLLGYRRVTNEEIYRNTSYTLVDELELPYVIKMSP